MATSYPGALDALTNPTGADALNSATVPHATQHANANDAIEAIQAELGVNPKGSSATVVARLETLAPLNSPTFTGTVNGITKSMIGLGSVDNTADTAKPISTATQNALDLKSPIANPTFTGTVQLGTSAVFSLEGSVDDAFETTITVSNLTADRTIIFPNADGTIALINQPGIPLSAANIQLAITTLANTGTIPLAFDGVGYKTQPALIGDITYTGSGYAAGRSVTVRVINGGTTRNLTFPGGWVFVGTKPANIAASKTGILTVTSFGDTEADCVAAWAVQG